MICECCGRDEQPDGSCQSCDEDRRQGDLFTMSRGMPWDRSTDDQVRHYISQLPQAITGWYD